MIMSKDHDFISSNDAVFDNRQKSLLQLPGETGVLSKWDVPQQAFDDLMPLQAEWETRYAAAKNPNDRTHAQGTAKNDARKTTYESALHTFIGAYPTCYPKFSDDTREAPGLPPVHRNGRTPTQVPHRYPFFRIDSPVIRRPGIHFYDNANEKRHKPEGVHGAEIRWDFSDVPVVEPGKLLRSGFDTASPCTVDFSPVKTADGRCISPSCAGKLPGEKKAHGAKS
jgi:hypothetical protein